MSQKSQEEKEKGGRSRKAKLERDRNSLAMHVAVGGLRWGSKLSLLIF